MSRILVTGGHGFLGQHVQQAFHNKGHETWFPSSKELNLLEYPTAKGIIGYLRPDAILHLAAVCGGILANKKSPASFLRDNTQMALNIYEAARELEVGCVYSLGSVCAYPKHCPIPFKEDDIWNGAPEETNFPYGQSKRTLMMLGQTYRQQYGMCGAHLIPVNLYGEYDHFDPTNSHVIPALIRKFVNAVDNSLPTVECWGTGEATREFLYAGDAAEAIVKAIDTGLDTDLPINLGTGQDISIKDAAILIATLTDYKGEITFSGGLDGQPKRMLDVSRAKKMLNWKANTSFLEGLLRTISWYRQNSDAS